MAETGEDVFEDGQEVGDAFGPDHPVPHGLELLPAARVGDVAGVVEVAVGVDDTASFFIRAYSSVPG